MGTALRRNWCWGLRHRRRRGWCCLALKPGFFYGVELAHHFHFDHPVVSLGAYTSVEGSLSEVVKTTRNVDIIIASSGATFGIRGFGRLLPVLRGGIGFILADGTPGNLGLAGRLQFHAGAGLRYFPLDWLVLRTEVKAYTHDNLQYGAGSGQLKNVTHYAVTAGIGIAR